MPHFIIECSDNIIQESDNKRIMREIFNTAYSTGIFAREDIKVRVKSYQDYLLDEGKNDFIHVFGNIMEGRNDEQKMNLSKKIVGKLKELFPDASIISMNIREFEKASYCKKDMV